MSESARDRLIFALDVGESLEEALELVDMLKDHVGVFKIGKEAFTRFGPSIVHETAGRGGKVFLDLKFHDIPNTVGRAVESALTMPVSMLTVHASGGSAMMKEATASVRRFADHGPAEPPLLLAVTVLTSLNDDDLKEIGFSLSTKDLVTRLASLAREAGIPGVVASPNDIAQIKKACGDDFIVVTPGIRLDDGETKDDQKRTLTPEQAIREGADFIVVGRPIRTAADPAKTARGIVDMISEAWESAASRH